MFKQKNYFAIGAVVFVAVLILSLPASATARLKLVVTSWFLPLFGLAEIGQKLPADLADNALPRRELLQQINSLRKENQQLHVQQLQTAATARENDELRAALNWQRQTPWKLKLANVVARDPANWWRSIQIDLGSRDGVQTNFPVLTADGLIGRVSSVSYSRAQVVLVGDPNCRVSGIVENAAHDMGIISAEEPIDNSLLQMTYLAGNANLKAGENVFTSGLGGIFPKGIPIGQIVDSRAEEFGLYTDARVKLNANLGALEQVWVLFK